MELSQLALCRDGELNWQNNGQRFRFEQAMYHQKLSAGIMNDLLPGQFEDKDWLVLGFCMDYRQDREEPQKDHLILLEAAVDMLTQLKLTGCAAICAGMCMAVLPVEKQSQLMKACLELCTELSQTLGVTVRCAASAPYRDLELLCKARVEVEEAMVYTRFVSEPPLVVLQPSVGGFIREGPRLETVELSSINVLTERMANAMGAGNRELLNELSLASMNFILRQMPRVSAIHIMGIHFSKPLEMGLVGQNIIDQEYLDSFQLARRLMETDSEAQFRQVFQNSMEELFDYAQSRREIRYARQMMEIMEYIIDNLSDSELSITSVASKFGLKGSTLSSQFKSYFGDSIPDTIHRLRVTRIKKALMETGKSAKCLALENGYVSVATMNRAFVKLEGMYPGQFRKKNQG